MVRVSERIEHHARRARERIVHHSKRVPPEVRIAFGILLGLLIVTSAFYLREEQRVQQMHMTEPIPCKELTFPANQRLCITMLENEFSSAPALERKPICDHAVRMKFDVNISLCAIYDATMTRQLYAANLADRGISVWEPEENITALSLHVISLSAIKTPHLICDGAMIDAEWTGNGTTSLATLKAPINGTCIIVANNDQGSLTSEKFRLIG